MAASTEFDISQLRISLGKKSVALFATAFARIAGTWRAMRNRRAVAQLLDWDPAMLKDIGLTAGDVRSAMSGSVLEDPSYRLNVLSVERRASLRAAAREKLALTYGAKVVPIRATQRERVRMLEI